MQNDVPQRPQPKAYLQQARRSTHLANQAICLTKMQNCAEKDTL